MKKADEVIADLRHNIPALLDCLSGAINAIETIHSRANNEGDEPQGALDDIAGYCKLVKSEIEKRLLKESDSDEKN